MAVRTVNIATSATPAQALADVAGVSHQVTAIVLGALTANSAEVFWGGSDVTTSTGVPLKAGEYIFLDDVYSIDDIYVCSVAAQNCRVAAFTK